MHPCRKELSQQARGRYIRKGLLARLALSWHPGFMRNPAFLLGSLEFWHMSGRGAT